MSLIDNIKESEGFRSRVYKDTLQIDTIRFGFAIKDLHLDEDIATMILERKIAELRIRVNNKFPFITDMPKDVQDVLIEMCCQLGVNGVSKFRKTIKHLQDHNFKEAAIEMLDSKWATQTPNRAKKLSDVVKYAK